MKLTSNQISFNGINKPKKPLTMAAAALATTLAATKPAKAQCYPVNQYVCTPVQTTCTSFWTMFGPQVRCATSNVCGFVQRIVCPTPPPRASFFFWIR
jgi:hypothetical protein